MLKLRVPILTYMALIAASACDFTILHMVETADYLVFMPLIDIMVSLNVVLLAAIISRCGNRPSLRGFVKAGLFAALLMVVCDMLFQSPMNRFHEALIETLREPKKWVLQKYVFDSPHSVALYTLTEHLFVLSISLTMALPQLGIALFGSLLASFFGGTNPTGTHPTARDF